MITVKVLHHCITFTNPIGLSRALPTEDERSLAGTPKTLNGTLPSVSSGCFRHSTDHSNTVSRSCSDLFTKRAREAVLFLSSNVPEQQWLGPLLVSQK